MPLDYLTRAAARAYLKEVLDNEYPPERAAADERTLIALDLLPPAPTLRALRARLLEENVAGFYDERPGRKRMFAISERPHADARRTSWCSRTSCATPCRTSTWT